MEGGQKDLALLTCKAHGLQCRAQEGGEGQREAGAGLGCSVQQTKCSK